MGRIGKRHGSMNVYIYIYMVSERERAVSQQISIFYAVGIFGNTLEIQKIRLWESIPGILSDKSTKKPNLASTVFFPINLVACEKLW